MMNPPPISRLRLTGRAQRFLRVLMDLGHINDAGLDQILATVGEMIPPGQDGAEVVVDVDFVKRVAAMSLFDVDPPPPHLHEDWLLLFT